MTTTFSVSLFWFVWVCVGCVVGVHALWHYAHVSKSWRLYQLQFAVCVIAWPALLIMRLLVVTTKAIDRSALETKPHRLFWYPYQYQASTRSGLNVFVMNEVEAENINLGDVLSIETLHNQSDTKHQDRKNVTVYDMLGSDAVSGLNADQVLIVYNHDNVI